MTRINSNILFLKSSVYQSASADYYIKNVNWISKFMKAKLILSDNEQI